MVTSDNDIDSDDYNDDDDHAVIWLLRIVILM